MPTHHACHSCGYPLSRLRAAPDPHYQLPIITCPECDTSVVRRPDPAVQGLRTAWKSARALIYIIIQSAVAFLLMLAAAALITNTAQTAQQQYNSNPLALFLTKPQLLRQDQLGPELAILAIILLLVGVLTGAWIKSALNHLNTPLVMLAFVLLPLAFLLQFGLRYWLWREFFQQPNSRPWGDVGMYRRIPDILTASAMHAAFIAAGFPLANTLRTIWAAQHRARWSRRRRARRRLRDDR
ncbi:MAG: hypothetical protein AB8F26_10645 [Phycisphaerales bacterium]